MTIASLDNALAKYNRHVDSVHRYYKVAKNGYEYYQGALDFYQRHFGYTVFIEQHDVVFKDLVKWFRSTLPEKRQRVLIANSLESYDQGFADGGENVNLTFAGTFDRVMTIAGHKMRVLLTNGNIGRGMQQPVQAGAYFYARSKAGRAAAISMIAELNSKRTSMEYEYDDEEIVRDPNLYALGAGNNWDRLHVPWRPVDSVILADGQMERITADVQEFVENERFYVRRSLPYHRGYLFYGPPGTGKTSLVRALAKNFGLDLWTIPLGDIKRDADLVSLVRNIRGRAILLLEDVDVYSTVTTRKQQGEKATLSGLLNTIDGVGTPHGLITVLTTNHVDRLDEALLRPGRVDVAEELAAPSGDQIHRLFSYFYEEEPTVDFTGLAYPSTAAVTEVFKQHLRDPRAAEKTLLGDAA